MAFKYAVLLVLIPTAIIMVVATNAALRAANKRTAGDNPGRIVWPAFCATLAALLVVITLVFIGQINSHGLESWDMNTADVLHSFQNTPVESELPDDLQGVIVIYYRFGCESCEVIWPELSATVQGKNVYFVSTRSETGKSLLEKYPVTEVPTGIYITHDGLFYSERLYYYDTDKQITFDTNALQRLFDFQKNNY